MTSANAAVSDNFFFRWRAKPMVLPPDALEQLIAEEKAIEVELAQPGLDKNRQRQLRNRLDENFTLQRRSFLEEIHPANHPDYVELYAPPLPDEPWTESLERFTAHPLFSRVVMPVMLISPPAFLRIYPIYCPYRHVYIKPFSKAQLKRRKMIWRRNVLAEGYQAKGPVERFGGKAMVAVALGLFGFRLWAQYRVFADSTPPWPQNGLPD